jgi:AcrR family transcriptional regulator
MARAARVEQLLNVAEVLFAEYGYDGTSIERIAKSAGITRPVVYDHFGSKEGIYLACVSRARERFELAVAEGIVGVEDLEQRLYAGLDACFAFIEEDPDRWAVMFRGVAVQGHVADEALRMRFATVTALADLIHDAVPNAARQKVEAFAHALSGAGEQLERWWRQNPELTRREIVDYFHAFAWQGLSQLAPE